MDELRHSDKWTISYQDTFSIEIINWGKCPDNKEGTWNYYVTIPERVLGPKFKDLWLPDIKSRYSKAGNEHLIHDYESEPFSSYEMEWHGGVTFYEKVGSVEGHRAVKLGCDFAHYNDIGQQYSLTEVYNEAYHTAEKLFELYKNDIETAKKIKEITSI